jgi:hypothetical protein
MEPRNVYSCGQGDTLACQQEGKADALQAVEGSRPGHDRASVEDTTGV